VAWILNAVGCSFFLLRRVCWPALEECYGYIYLTGILCVAPLQQAALIFRQQVLRTVRYMELDIATRRYGIGTYV
jgi:hypothetical protein